MKETGGPAFPQQMVETDRGRFSVADWGAGGMTLREYAAIELRIPDSGIDWLDKMIAKAERRDLAAKAMQGILALGAPPAIQSLPEFEMVTARRACEMADAMIVERGKQ